MSSSTVVISQLPTGECCDSISENILGDAMLDQLMHNAYNMKLQGKSMRKVLGQLTEGEHLH